MNLSDLDHRIRMLRLRVGLISVGVMVALMFALGNAVDSDTTGTAIWTVSTVSMMVLFASGMGCLVAAKDVRREVQARVEHSVLLQHHEPEPDWYDAAEAAGLFQPLEIEVGEVEPGLIFRDNATFLAELEEELLTDEEREAREEARRIREQLAAEKAEAHALMNIEPRAREYARGGFTHGKVPGGSVQVDVGVRQDRVMVRALSGRTETMTFDRGIPTHEVKKAIVEHLRQMNAADLVAKPRMRESDIMTVVTGARADILS